MPNIHILSDRPRKSSASKARAAALTKSRVVYYDKVEQEQADKAEKEQRANEIIFAWKKIVATAYVELGTIRTDTLRDLIHSEYGPNKE